MKSRPKALRTTRKGARSSFSIHAKGEKQSCREPPKRKRTWKPRSQTFRRRIRNSRTSLTLSPISWRPLTMTTRTMITATMATMTTTETTTRTDPGPELWAVAQGNAERNRPRPPLRANHCPPPGQPICAFCGSTRYVEVGHLDGFEENTEQENLVWNCRSCNTRLGVVFKRLGIGRRTRQYNPAQKGPGRYQLGAVAHRCFCDEGPINGDDGTRGRGDDPGHATRKALWPHAASPPGSSRRAGVYSPVLRLTADEMSLPYCPVPKSSPSGTRLYCRGGHFGSGSAPARSR